MFKKISLLLGFSVCIMSASFAQTIKENLEKRAKDPATAENAAKADVYILRNKISNDSTSARKLQPVMTDKKKNRKDSSRKGKQF